MSGKIKAFISNAAIQFRVTPDDICGPRRHAHIVHARHAAMFLAVTETPHSLATIGRQFSRDESTVHAAVRKITALIESDVDLAGEIAAIKGRVITCESATKGQGE